MLNTLERIGHIVSDFGTGLASAAAFITALAGLLHTIKGKQPRKPKKKKRKNK